MPMELMFGRPAELEMLREQIESVDDITAIGDDVRGIVGRNWAYLVSKLLTWEHEDGVAIPSALAPIADAKAVRCRAAANGAPGHNRPPATHQTLLFDNLREPRKDETPGDGMAWEGVRYGALNGRPAPPSQTAICLP